MATITITDLELANALRLKEATELTKAVDAALEAMASYGTELEHMDVLAKLLVVAKREQHQAFRRLEQEGSDG